ncbi:MAG TPA: zinc ribbon domain-containing protein [Terriglobales bacterium]|nr:zinc ribbon domain-containing protein [Terriglobales bacterium]
MFCNSCGKELQTGQQFCGACGQPVGVARVPSATNRVAENIKVLSVLWLVYASFTLLGGFAVWVFMNAFLPAVAAEIARTQPNAAPIPAFFHAILTFVVIAVLAKGALDLAAGVGLLQRAPWGRIVALIAAFISLLNLPFGTAIGIYTLWALLTGDADKQYERLAQGA